MGRRLPQVALVAALAACGSKTDDRASAADAERARATDACKRGDGPSCLVAAAGLDYLDKDQLNRALELWMRGCDLGNGPCCAQLGTSAEFGMATGGKRPDPVTAARYYAAACRLHDDKSCKKIGKPVKPPPFAWREALTPVCGQGHAELGPLFAGLVPGAPLPAAMKDAIAAFETKFKAHVHYFQGDADPASWFLDVGYDEKEGLYPVLVAGWGKPDLPFGAWTSDTAHVIAYWTHDGQRSGVSWHAYASPAEVIAPDDKTKLGFEPFAVVGGKLADLQAALGERLHRDAEDTYHWTTLGPGPSIEIRVTAVRGIITELRTFNWITNVPSVGDALLAELEAKWGPPQIDAAGVHSWKLPGRVVRASRSGGNFELAIAKR